MSSTAFDDQRVHVGQRKKRADCGSVRLSERDAQLLLLIAEQYSVSVDQLARLIGRTHRTGRWLRDRWRKAGWVESRKLTADGPSFVWLTAAGARLACSPYRIWRPNAALAGHIKAVTEVRMLLEQQLRLGGWLCERSLAQTLLSQPGARPHLPDAVLKRGGEEIAIEVELTLKSRGRLEALIDELGQNYAQVWYFADASLTATLRLLATDTPWQNISVYSYPPRPGELRR